MTTAPEIVGGRVEGATGSAAADQVTGTFDAPPVATTTTAEAVNAR